MKKRIRSWVGLVAIIILTIILTGCGGGSDSGVKRIAGLDPAGVVKTFFDAAKNNRMNEAGLYVSSASQNDPRTVFKYLTNQTTLNQIQTANILSLRKLAEQDNYAIVLATLQDQADTLKISVKPVGLEKVNGEWYIVDFDQILRDAKYKVLQQLLSSVKI